MRSLFASLILAAAFAPVALAQTSVDVTTQAGTLASNLAGTTDTGLYLPASIVIARNDPTNGLVTGDLGSLSLFTPKLTSGSLTQGGSFGAGGGVMINIPGYSISTFKGTYNAAFTSGTWTKVTLANGTHSYTLSASFTSSQGVSGALVVQTVNIGSGLWSGHADVYVIDLNLQLP
jgi:hypothetical protein